MGGDVPWVLITAKLVFVVYEKEEERKKEKKERRSVEVISVVGSKGIRERRGCLRWSNAITEVQ